MGDHLQALDLEIKQLERDKRVEEIRQLKANSKTKWITPAALAALIPLIAGFGVWTVNELKQYSAGHQALADKARLVQEAAALQQQKSALSQEIVALLMLKTHYADEYRALEEKVKTRQAQIDTAHLRARFAVAEATYALDHVNAIKPDQSKVRALAEQAAKLPAEISAQFTALAREYEFALKVIEITKKGLKYTNQAVEQIPASDWTAKLNPMPTGSIISRRQIMISMGDAGRLYDVGVGRFLSPEEADKLRADP
jgi:hypothetical protein